MTFQRRIVSLFLLTGLLLTNCIYVLANESERTIKVVTYNMYLGADFSDIFQAQSGAELVSEVAEAYSEMLAGNVPERAAAVADQIEASKPVLVGLQEVALWRTGPIFDPASAETVTVDQLQLLLDALEARGLHYAPVAVQTNLDAELPAVFGPAAALDIRFTDRVVILARTDLDVSRFKLQSVQTGTFETLLPVSSPTIGTITIPRGWASADVKLRGKEYRFITTHLESFYEPVQFGQAFELLQGPANTDKSVILTGDLNSDAAASGASYQLIAANGFSDVWSITHPLDTGFTWPLSGELPSVILNPTQRLDLIMTRGTVTVSASDVLGEDPVADLTPSGFRPSDHAGLVANLVLQP
ncbi:MAG: endonuclease/exonuclease/phosphatase family protein [Pyrinomonadaceae bacterium]